MSSNLKVNSIVPATGNNVAIGTVGGTITYNAPVSGSSTFSDATIFNDSISVAGVSTFSSGLNVTGGSVGIGTDNPLTKTHIDGANGDNSTLLITASDLDANNGGIISLGGNYDGTNRTTFAQIKGLKDNNTSGQYGGYLSFLTRTNGQSPTERLRVDSNGRIIKPYQPSFHATITSIGQINTDGYGVILWNDVTNNGNHNIGGHYSTSTGRFTAPVAGRYLISARSLTNSTANSNPYVVIYIRINGNNIAYLAHNHSDFWLMESYTGILNLSVDDYVDVYLEQASAHGFQNYASFSGHLLS